MLDWIVVILLFCLISLSNSLPTISHGLCRRSSSCPRPLVRKEWRSLPGVDRKSYLAAVKCMMAKPAWTSVSDLPGVTNHFEDFLGDHILQTDANHFTGSFYPWHRLLIWQYEQEIRKCGFNGAQPYWDWTLDSGSAEDFFNSPVFDTEAGFGGNGEWVPGTKDNPAPGMTVVTGPVPDPFDDRTGGGCIRNGPFANMSIHLGPLNSVKPNEHCVRRDFTPSIFMNHGSSKVVAELMSFPDFGYFTNQSDPLIHLSGHAGPGGIYGTLTDLYSSPGDPLFYLHHANMDRAWWSWQSRDLLARLTDISGPLIPFDTRNEKGRNITLDDVVHTGTTVNVTVAVRELMDIEADYLCYTYDKLH